MSRSAASSHSVPPDPSAQQRVASDPAASVWVNASAGSGKTTILTSRVTRLLLAGVPPQKILCLTFTRAAAAEMALRVNKELSAWAVCSENELSARLGDLQGRAPLPKEMTRARQLFATVLACPGGMRIRTLHAFGQEILRRFPIEAGLPPHFAVIEEEEAKLLQGECLNDVLRDISHNPASSVARAMALLIGQLGEKGFREMVLYAVREKNRVAQAMAQHGGLDQLMMRTRAALDLAPDDDETNLAHAAFQTDVFPEVDIRAAAKILLQGTPTYRARGEAIVAWLELAPEERLARYKEYLGGFLTKDRDFFHAYGDKKLLAAHPALDVVLRREATRLRSLAERCEAANIAAITEATLIFGHALADRYTARKQAQAALDYDDLVHETLRLLQRPGIAPWVLHKLDDGLDHLLVDEAQDTSRAQWDIVATLMEEFFAGTGAHDDNRTLFVVGDEKQSIYSFQNADPEAFATMRDFFKNKIRAAEKKWDEVPLHVSFRSAPAILRAVDAVFAAPDAADGVSDDPVRHTAFKRDLCGRVELWPLIAPPEKDVETPAWPMPVGYEAEHDPQAELAAHIARTIKGWLKRGECLPGANRPIRPGDIMILLRRRGRFADVMVRALKQKPQDVPVSGVDRMHLVRQLPVMDLLALVQFALLPEDDLNLATILRGPLLGLSEDDLMLLAAGRGTASLWQRLKNSGDDGAEQSPSRLREGLGAGQDVQFSSAHQSARGKPTSSPPSFPPASGREGFSDEVIERLQKAHTYLAGWLNRADFMTPFAMLTHILNEPCPACSVSGRRAIWSRLGLDALDPIEELLNAAQDFSHRHAPSLQHFLHWLAVGDSEIKRELDRGEDAGPGQVRIMTVHASKGLEAPIVFLPDTAGMPRVQDVPKFLWREDGAPLYLAVKPDTGAARRVWNQARARQLEEYRRLLYVALTRASHRLYIGGWEPARQEPDSEGSWHNLVRRGLAQSESHARDTDEGVIVWEDPALPGVATTPPSAPLSVVPLPAWVLRQAPVEKAEAAALAPSQLGATPAAATPDQAFARGRIIHRLLQSLPDVAASRRNDAARRFLMQPQHHLSTAQQDDIRIEVMRLLEHPDYAALFGEHSRAEVPLAGMVGGQNLSGQVDRLAMVGNEVWVVDYKTNRPPPPDITGVPALYRTQMEAYRGLLRAIYPNRVVRCFLLWTYGPRFMEI